MGLDRIWGGLMGMGLGLGLLESERMGLVLGVSGLRLCRVHGEGSGLNWFGSASGHQDGTKGLRVQEREFVLVLRFPGMDLGVNMG